MPEPRVFSVDIPEEPPDMSVLAAGSDGDGMVWMRNDPLGHKGPGVWYSAGPVFIGRDEASISPLSWRFLLATHEDLTVLRWGQVVPVAGESGEVSPCGTGYGYQRHLDADEPPCA